MVEFASTPETVEHKGMIALVAAVLLGCALGGYAIHDQRAADGCAERNAASDWRLDGQGE